MFKIGFTTKNRRNGAGCFYQNRRWKRNDGCWKKHPSTGADTKQRCPINHKEGWEPSSPYDSPSNPLTLLHPACFTWRTMTNPLEHILWVKQSTWEHFGSQWEGRVCCPVPRHNNIHSINQKTCNSYLIRCHWTQNISLFKRKHFKGTLAEWMQTLWQLWPEFQVDVVWICICVKEGLVSWRRTKDIDSEIASLSIY